MIGFNNREVAVFIVFLLFLLFIFYKASNKQDIADSFIFVFKSLTSKYILITIVFFTVYMFSEIVFLEYIAFVDKSMLKEAIVWAFGAFGLIVKHQKIIEQKNFLRQLLFDNLKLVILFEFIYNMYTFNLFIEVIIVFVATLLLMIKTVLEYEKLDENQELTLKVVKFFINFIGFIIIIFTVHQLYYHYQQINVLQNIKVFILPFVMMFFYIPFYYSTIIYLKYENIFYWVDFYVVKNKKISNYLKRKILFYSFFNYSKLRYIHQNLYNFQNIVSTQEVDNIFEKVIK